MPQREFRLCHFPLLSVVSRPKGKMLHYLFSEVLFFPQWCIFFDSFYYFAFKKTPKILLPLHNFVNKCLSLKSLAVVMAAWQPAYRYIVLVQPQWKLSLLISRTNPFPISSIISGRQGPWHLRSHSCLQVQSSRAPPRDQVSNYSPGYVVRLWFCSMGQLCAFIKIKTFERKCVCVCVSVVCAGTES